MIELNNHPLQAKILNLLQDQEELEFFEKPHKEAYDRVAKNIRLAAVVLAMGCTGLFFYHLSQSAGYIAEFLFGFLKALLLLALLNTTPIVFYVKAQKAKGTNTQGIFTLSSIWTFFTIKASTDNATLDNNQYQQNRSLSIRLFIVCNIGFLILINSMLGFFLFKRFLMYNLLPVLVYLGAFWYQQLYANSFYAFSNMRLLFTQGNSIDYVYYKDIRDLKVNKDILSIDTGDYGNNNTLRLQVIRGVKDIDTFVKVINQKLLKYRLPD